MQVNTAHEPALVGRQETIMTYNAEAGISGNDAAVGTSTRAASDTQYLTIHEVLRAGRARTVGRKEMVAAQSSWDSEGGAHEAGK
jgi:hypothetical protein